MGIVKSVVKHPVMSAVALAGGIALTVATGGAALPIMVAAGATIGAGQIGYGVYKAATADSDAEAKQAFETMGNGTFEVATSALGAKAALSGAAKAGVKGAECTDDLNTAQALGKCFTVAPEATKVSAANIAGNAKTLVTGAISANSNKLRSEQVRYMSKANDAQAHRFNPNGTDAEILKNNPGVFKGDDGNFYLPNKWSPEEPYLIDSSKEQMIMMYGGDDMAVCDGGIFKGSYVDQTSLKTNGQLNYQDPTTLEYGKVMDVTKQAPGGFKIVDAGTKVNTLEGVRTVKAGEVVAVDHAGNPYVTPASNILKRNIPLDTPESAAGFEKLANLK